MKLTRQAIKKLIKEELTSMLDEGAFADAGKEFGDWAAGRNPGLVAPAGVVDPIRVAQAAKAKDAQAGESLKTINAKLDQILHILSMTK